MAAMIIVSLLTAIPVKSKILGLTYATTVSEDRERSRLSWNYKDVLLSVFVVVIIAFILFYFSPLVMN
jgi:SSS family solute:Na+ symporter